MPAIPPRQLWYFEDRTPAGWQPKHFREADPAELKFSRGRDDKEIDSKLKIKIGDLTTPHHTLSVRQRRRRSQCLAGRRLAST